METSLKRLGGFFSFEMLFVLFLFAGTYKASHSLAPVSEIADLTVAMVVAGLVSGGALVLMRGLRLDRRAFGYLYLYFVFLSYALVSFLVTEPSPFAVVKIQKLLVMNTWALCGPLFIMNSEERVRRFLRLLLLFTLLGGLDAILRRFMGGPHPVLEGTFGTGGYQGLGRMVGAGIVIASVYAILETGAVARAMYALVGALLLFPLLLSGTRQAVLGLLAAAVFVVCSIGTIRQPYLALSRVFLVLIMVGALAFGARSTVLSELKYEYGRDRVLEPLGEPQAVLAGSKRLELWKTGLSVWLKHPVFGVGFGGLWKRTWPKRIRHPHNLFIESLCELGPIGLLLVCGLLGIPLGLAFHKASLRGSPLMVTAGALLAYTLACAMVSGDVTDNRHIFTYSSLVICCEMARREKERLLPHGTTEARPWPGG